MPALSWTPSQEDQLRRLWPVSSTADVARAMGKTRRSVTLKAHRLGLTRTYETTGYVMTTIRLPKEMRDKLQAEADLRAITIGSVIREAIAAHLGLPKTGMIAVKGGPRKGAGRKAEAKPASFIPRKPSMPFVNIGRD